MRRYLPMLPLIFLLAACGSNGPSSQGTAAAEFWFESLPEMVATSDVAILGTVVDVRDGTTEGPPGEEIQHLDTVIKVDESFYGSIEASTTLTVQTLKFASTSYDAYLRSLPRLCISRSFMSHRYAHDLRSR